MGNGKMLSMPRRSENRIFCALHPHYQLMVEDGQRLADDEQLPWFVRAPGRDEIRQARQEQREEPPRILVVPLERHGHGPGTARLGWRWPHTPTAGELADYAFEPGLKLAGILKGAERAIAREKKRGKNAWKIDEE
jgi:hypothetical protein